MPELPPGPYDALDPLASERLEQALELMHQGALEDARAILADIALAQPRNIVVGRWLQEVEVALGERAQREAPQGTDPPNPLAALRQQYRERADSDPTPASLVLAARLEDDPPAALLLLERASELDPACAWAHYGRAHVLAAMGRWGHAREQVEEALAADPAHLPTLRLHAWMLARSGRREEAIAALEAWLERAAADPRFDRRSRDEARLDLALMLLAEGRAEAARENVLSLHPGTVDAMRRLSAQTAVEHALGENAAARESARAAQRADPMAILPVVQEALLLEYWLQDPLEAERAWRRARELAEVSEELGALVQRIRAQVHQSRLAHRARGPELGGAAE